MRGAVDALTGESSHQSILDCSFPQGFLWAKGMRPAQPEETMIDQPGNFSQNIRLMLAKTNARANN
jgi:hypothetical protein